jgi:putative ABC transport system permease protein
MFIGTIVYESAAQAFGQLLANKLRSFLSLLGITIGIWCIIAVLSAIDSLDANIRGSFNRLGNNVVYVSKQPWGEDPEDSYWKYMHRPNPTYKDFKAIRENVNSAGLISFSLFMGFKNIQYKAVNLPSIFCVGASEEYGQQFNVEFAKGRFFSPVEVAGGNDVVVLGYDVADKLFPGNQNPIGEKVTMSGHKMTVIGVVKKSGKSLINPFNFDNAGIIPYQTARKFVNVKSDILGASIGVRAREGVSFEKLKDDVTGELRRVRHLPPSEKDNFSLNSLSVISNIFDNFFGVMRAAGFFIGIFSIFVGIFSVANIMFVSVRERTNIIGIKKSLGAPRIFILIEFLVEAIVLCIIGGALGLFLVWLAALGASSAAGFDIYLSTKNITLGLSIAAVTGLIAGILPAWQAAKMDPLEAIRTGQ